MWGFLQDVIIMRSALVYSVECNRISSLDVLLSRQIAIQLQVLGIGVI